MELLKLVIVDDEPILLQGLLDTYDWESMGFEVVGSAKSGVQALEVIRREQPHVVLTDIRMKQMTGLMVMEEIQKEQISCLFVVLSAYRDFEYAKHACDLGAYAYLLKPFRQEDVFFQLDQILKTNCSIRLKTADSIFMKLNTDDIYFIQAFGRNMLFSTKHGEVCSRQYTMKSLDEILPDHFERCHKSFLVNTKYIHSVNPKERTLHIKEIDDDIPYGKDFHLG